MAQSGREETNAELDAQRLLGKAYYENDHFHEAVAEFRQCIALAPQSAVDHFNLALVLMRAKEYEGSLHMLKRAEALDPDLLNTYYIRGIVHSRQGNYEQALVSLRYIIEHDPKCVGAYYNAGVCLKNLDRHQEAIDMFRQAAELAPQHPSVHYQLITLYRRIGDVENADRHREIFASIKDTIDESEKTAEALERSKYTYIVQAERLTQDLTPKPLTGTRFVDVTAAAGIRPGGMSPVSSETLPIRLGRADYDPAKVRARFATLWGGAVALGDYDGDGDLDLYVVHCAAEPEAAINRLYKNDGKGKFVDVTEAAGVGDSHFGLDAVFGDYDNDGWLDLYVANDGPNVLYRNEGDGTFEDVSKPAGVDEPQFGRTALFFDYDHDNDVDLFIGNQFDLDDPPDAGSFDVPGELRGAFDTLLRNNGNGTFTDQTDEAGLLIDRARTTAALIGDLDGDSDMDLFVVNADGPPRFYANQRLGRMKVAGTFAPPLTDKTRTAAEGDFNRDGAPDLLIAVAAELRLYLNDGHAGFQGSPIPLPERVAGGGVRDIRTFDFNNDGWTDLLLTAADEKSLVLLAGAGPGRFADVSAEVGLAAFSGTVADLDLGDLNDDGAVDIVLQTRDRGPVVLMNENAEPAHWLGVRLVGKKVSKCAYGATVELASGGHYQRQIVRGGALHFGIGDLKRVDVIRVTWPNGVAQNVVRPPINQQLTVEEHVRVSASCGFLYAYNGRRFELINEILGIGPLGVPMAPGVYHQPDCTELTRIEAEQLVARDGVFDLRLTEELREITYADQITLRVVDHPEELEVIPNEMFTAPPFPEDKFFAVGDHRLPVSAVADDGTDVTDLLRQRDGRFPTFPLTRYDGVAVPHTLTLDFGDLSGSDAVILFLDGWIYWPESSTVMAVAQDPRFEITPLTLAVRDQEGQWRTVVESVGLPTSKGLIVPVDLTGRFLSDDRRIRLSTNLCVYFDRVFVSRHDQAEACRVEELPVRRASLAYRGFSEMIRDSLGFERFDYHRASPLGAWSPPDGWLTRYGDVTELLGRVDDRYVIFGPGDELSMEFDAEGLPDLPSGWTRDFVFYANGWVKDGDLNTLHSQTVSPLPFHAMSGYPYSADESYPVSPLHQEYLATYNTRPGRSTIGALPGRQPSAQPISAPH